MRTLHGCYFFVAVAQSFVTNPPPGSLLSYDESQSGPTINCVGYVLLGTDLALQPTRWSVTERGKNTTSISVSTSTFMLSSDLTPFFLLATTNLTVLNVTSNLDGATINCFNPNTANFASFVVKIYRKSSSVVVCMHKVTGAKLQAGRSVGGE